MKIARLSALLPALILINVATSAQLPLQPDFAHPRTVIDDARNVLDCSTGIDRMQALMQTVAASVAIDPDSLPLWPARVAACAADEPDGAVAALLRLYQANLYATIYLDDAYRYDRVETPLTPYPANPVDWNGSQFKDTITALIDNALVAVSPSAKQPLRRFSQVVDADDATLRYYPVLGDFAFVTAHRLFADCGLESRADSVARLAAASAGPESLFKAVATTWLPDSLPAVYARCPRGEYGAVLLLAMRPSTPAPQYVGMLRSYLADNTANPLTDAVAATLEAMTRPEITFTLDNIAAPGRELPVAVRHDYTRSVGFNIYRVTNPSVADIDRQTLRSVGNVLIDTDSLLAEVVDTLYITLDRPGQYVIRPIVDGIENTSRWQDARLTVTPVVPMIFGSGDDRTAVIVDYLAGSPASGVEVLLHRSAYRKKSARQTLSLGITGPDGIVNFRMPAKNSTYTRMMLAVKVGSDTVYFPDRPAIYDTDRPQTPQSQCRANVLTGRSLYHPGDSIDWCVIAVNTSPSATAPAVGTGLDIILRDANFQEIDTISAVTDSYGRAYGAFPTPVDVLDGRYSIVVTTAGRYIAETTVMVSDFKVPPFEITDLVYNDSIVSGRAVTYAGMPVDDAKVTVDFNEMVRWWWRRPSAGAFLGSADGNTDAAGRFSIAIPESVAANRALVSASVTVVSRSGDAEQANLSFSVGATAQIIYQGDNTDFDTSSPVCIPVHIVTPAGTTLETEVDWTLTADGLPVLSGRSLLAADGLTLDLADAPAARYSLSVASADSALCKPVKDLAVVTLYNMSRNQAPTNVPLFVPRTRIEVSRGDVAHVTVAVPAASYLIVSIPGRNNACRVETRSLDPGFHVIDIKVDDKADTQTLRLATVKDGCVHAADCCIAVIDPVDVVLTAASWRDKVSAGSAESWTFRLARIDGSPVGGAMVATLYNQALDALYPFGWPDALPRLTDNLLSQWTFLTAAPRSCFFSPDINSAFKNVTYPPEAPAFRYQIYPGYGRREMMMNFTSRRMMKSAAPAMVNDLATGVADSMEESAEAVEAAFPEPSPDVQDELRQGITLQAFWMPALTVADDGSITLHFDLPADNATWAFRAFAWTRDARAASYVNQVVASRPLMVTPALPRFLREGDRAVLTSTVYNNSETTDTVTSTIEIFNPLDGSILSAAQSVDVIAPGASAVVSLPAGPVNGLAALGYRIIARTARFSDGEQVALPILPSDTKVYESRNFILDAARDTFTTVLPGDTAAVMALRYCQNPVWDVVQALPQLLASERNMSSPRAASVIYGALTARGLAARFPEIPQAMRIWTANPADSALVSGLMCNDDIKIAMLGQTPWVAAAASQTERMARLAMAFDSGEIQSAYSKAISALAKLQRRDGGFAWGEWSDNSSLWATVSVLDIIGRLNLCGFMPDDSRLSAMLTRALRYCDENVSPDDFIPARFTAYYPAYKPSTVNARKALQRVLQSYIRNWPKASTADKARYAIALNANGYRPVALEIMGSIAQFAVRDADGLVSFPSVDDVDSYATILEAFGLLRPDSPLLDGMRLWLVMRSRAMSSLGAASPAPLVSAILVAGTPWITMDDDRPDVMIGSEPYVPSKIEALTGAFSVRLSAADAGKSLAIRRAPQGPLSYGSLTTISTRPMAEMAAVDCPSLAIEKTLLVRRDGQWVVPDAVVRGEEVLVSLRLYVHDDLEYVTVIDSRPASLAPVDQLPGYVYADTLAFYRETDDAATKFFISRLPAGAYRLTYRAVASVEGTFASGIAVAQSAYAPEIVAGSAGSLLNVVAGEQ